MGMVVPSLVGDGRPPASTRRASSATTWPSASNRSRPLETGWSAGVSGADRFLKLPTSLEPRGGRHYRSSRTDGLLRMHHVWGFYGSSPESLRTAPRVA